MYASEVFQDEDSLAERLRDVPLCDNANYFLLNLESAEDILCSIVERLLAGQRLVFLASYT